MNNKEENTITITVTRSAVWWPLSTLRYLTKDGKNVLQQQWLSDMGDYEWRDIPIVE